MFPESTRRNLYPRIFAGYWLNFQKSRFFSPPYIWNFWPFFEISRYSKNFIFKLKFSKILVWGRWYPVFKKSQFLIRYLTVFFLTFFELSKFKNKSFSNRFFRKSSSRTIKIFCFQIGSPLLISQNSFGDFSATSGKLQFSKKFCTFFGAFELLKSSIFRPNFSKNRFENHFVSWISLCTREFL